MKRFFAVLTTLLIIASIFMVSIFCGYAYVTPSSYVNLNANASISYSINMFGRVLDFTSSNEIGEKIIKNQKLYNMKIDDAVQNTIDNLISGGYISQSNSNVSITVSNSDKVKADRLVKKLQESMKSYLVDKVEIKNFNVETVNKP